MNTKRGQSPLHRHRVVPRYGSPSARTYNSDFWCTHCHSFVNADPALSGVQNRNHCPYCLRSLHLDLFIAGDRLAACKSIMRPIALTIKNRKKKYGNDHGELMLIHKCDGCEAISLNRIATDDDCGEIFSVYEESFHMPSWMISRLDGQGISVLTRSERQRVLARLFGQRHLVTGLDFL
jgi:hypothetical protein